MKRVGDKPVDDADAKRSRADEATLHVYEPCVVLPLAEHMNALVEVLVPSRYLAADCKAVKQRRVWGSDVYTDDSDLVAVLAHTGHFKLKGAAPKSPLLVSLRVCPAQDAYTGSERSGFASRDWSGAHKGVSFKVERCLQHSAGTVPPPQLSLLRPGASRQMPTSLCVQEAGPGESFSVPPSASLAIFNLSNEPCYKYSLALVADQDTQAARWTSTRLLREALYLESKQRRFELAYKGTSAGGYATYTFSQVHSPQSMDRRALEGLGVPLPASSVKVLHSGVDWEEIVWGPCYLRLRGEEYPLLRLQYVSHTVA
ncbi:hypothetical protein EMIHUDRAFT_363397 [Emiliania huxleyi CCMP1516]|uniref:Uncharacterized protein n=2 Tax=Emiliania huxleyi TaxID=2903 RepID=A0A0D3KFW8_EMIH1|nr:hypothetical protein EMIHUDRAFT_363397 [Emiliania huxleyi CCMP1516]EOD34653.1 hypothetical protein EMIHUDRAFT_363397 [Emiliania huxleyi CCMP1516]|mmetsp:Transcript_2254/g.7285  ORF Transcript_2254/g.7285 Transcript_2254/m.7285 type:complete len:314 (-) Transcript_2254:173-1114(-)|eukprot:XP_005787082.1 hypothetical protein EMIHUDRAFT_363397 [Emiliania huxleyi CCMP1516]